MLLRQLYFFFQFVALRATRLRRIGLMLASTSRADLLAQRGCRCGTPGGSVRSSTQTRSSKNFTTKLPLTTTLGTGLARTGTNTGTPKGKKHFGGNQGLIDKKESTLQKETQGCKRKKKESKRKPKGGMGGR